MFSYKGASIIYLDYKRVLTSDISLTNKDECIGYLKNIQEILRIFLEKNKYPTQKVEISKSIFSIGELIKLIKNEY